MPIPRTGLDTFASAVAARLPGEWTSKYTRHDAYKDQFRTTERLWDLGHVNYIVGEFVVGHEAVLHGPDGQRLYLTDRPTHLHQFVVAPLAPDIYSHHFLGAAEPNGIAIPADPVRAAARITQRLLPRYERARDEVQRNSVHEAPPADTRPLPAPSPDVRANAAPSDGASSSTRTLDLLTSVLDPHHGTLELLANLFDTAADKARTHDTSDDDAFQLAEDLSAAAAGIRRIGEDLHVAPERMAALTQIPSSTPAPTRGASATPQRALPPAPPTPGLTASR
ncbi:hypothetical protein [Streptomyces sp. NPDC008122]|uniref:hypothetical protein n=1 Tax=Streptomyces sp. NPDC008122 TaxID=3364810 RepID=UPI0036F0E63B